VVRRGKGGKGRTVPFGPQTGRALDRYMRLRRAHRLAESAPLWLGDRGKGFTYFGLHAALKYRADIAGLTGFHPHVLRHTAASRWLAAGGTEGGLMAVAGWKLRRTALGHALLSYLFGTGMLAVAGNLVTNVAG